MLNGNVQETDTLKGPAGLSRSDIKQGGDPFGSGGGAPKQEAFDAAAGAFDFGGRQAPAPPPKKQLQGNAQDAGMANFQNGVPQFANQGAWYSPAADECTAANAAGQCQTGRCQRRARTKVALGCLAQECSS